jgi:hypothetical protein
VGATTESCSLDIAAGQGRQGRDVRFNGGGAGGQCGRPVTPEQTAAQRVSAVVAERDAVQANLLELDGSFARQVLECAALTGQTRDALLTGGCVRLAGPPVPLARRDLAAAGRPPVTLAAAVGAMRRAFAEVTAVTSAVEAAVVAYQRAILEGEGRR